MPRDEVITATGIRFVGAAARLAEEVQANRELPVGRDEDVLYAARFQLRPRLGNGGAAGTVHAALGLLDSAIRRDWEDAPPLVPDRSLRRPEARFRGLRWDTFGERGAWTGELVWRHPHPVIAGAPCTTHVVLTEHHGHVGMTVRVSADLGLGSVRGLVGAGQARPAFLVEMNRALRLAFDGGDTNPRPLQDDEIDGFVRYVLLAETRHHPVAVLAPLEMGGYLVPPEEVAEELLGLAHLYVIERHATTFRLSDSVGDRRLSAYWGALRAYMPGFTCADHSDDHPLLIRDSAGDPVMRAQLAGTLGRYARTRIPRPAGVAELRAPAPARQVADRVQDPRRESVAPVSPAIADAPHEVRTAAPDPAPAPEAPPPDAEAAATRPAPAPAIIQSPALDAMPVLLGTLGTRIGELASTIETLMLANRALADEIARLRTTTAVRAANTASFERRLDAFERLLREGTDAPGAGGSPSAISSAGVSIAAGTDASTIDDDPSDDEAARPTLVDVLRQAAESYPDTLLVLESAERAAERSLYEDTDRVAVILDAMAGVARRRQEGALGTSLRAAFRELGIDYRGFASATTSEKHRRQYLCKGADDRIYDCQEHIALGTSYDPRYCLRIYFTSRAPVEPRFVIGHVGRHFDVASTT